MAKIDFTEKIASLLNLDPSQVKPLTEKEQGTLYGVAFALYSQGNYANASEIFTELALSSPICEKYWRGLAASRQMAKEYQASLHAWALVALLNEQDPLPHFHAAECYISMGEKQEALKGLAIAKKRLSSSELDLQLSEKIQLLEGFYGSD